MDERTRILKLVENGVISAEQAISLLEKLSQEKTPNQSSSTPGVVDGEPATKIPPVQTESKEDSSAGEQFDQAESFNENEHQQRTSNFEEFFGKAFNNKKLDQVFNDIRQDVTEFSDRMMTFMNTTLSRVKSGEVPFGDKIEFEQRYAFPGTDINSFEIDIPNGKIEFIEAEDDQVLVTAFVKAPAIKNEGTDAQAQFLDGFVELKDQKLDITTQWKLAHVDLTIAVPRKKYDVVVTKLISGAVSLTSIDAKLLKAKTYNGTIKYYDGQFEHVDFQTVNGSIEVNAVEGLDLEASTANGRVYIDGKLKEIDAESVNGHVIVTTISSEAHKVKATTLAGAVELYLPKTVSMEGVAASNFGKVDVQLDEARVQAVEEQFLRKTIHFNKIVENATLLKVNAESRTGAVIVRYTGITD